MILQRASLDEIRGFYAKLMASISGSMDPRLERIFELVPREAFLPPGPWKIKLAENKYLETPSADPVYVYQTNVRVALDAGKGINNGEPMLHARWIGAVAPQPGETVTHIGTGTGYYSAVLSMLVRPGGRLIGFEIEQDLADAARRNLVPFENVSITTGDAVSLEVPPSDLIYVNAGVLAPPEQWLAALRPGGRMIFPWRPSQEVALAALVTRVTRGFQLKPLMPAWFIPLRRTGAPMAESGKIFIGTSTKSGLTPDANSAWRSRSIHLSRHRAPDDSATAIYENVWFSAAPVPA
jgi:protein-L-isoaspartate(D-aspartate) O-methyltransferase